ncbi:ATP-dependent DNA helicase DDX11-like [Chenopodium quinoa]|uniref:ATP-dependent DNA helicase DDX11-like n=1 Tax=Chenopodium quinoa TaxID=63459 RepID=UPI000B7703EC|nr:ATP-dependent DNA helicase DDX11-like [Chenopodium quinoa]XP_021750535.1 ATP-dependent DNA helicase DDX11-like [Chenopodium quinoa]
MFKSLAINHSQLFQFIKELNKTVFGSELKVVSLGSRKNLCINQEVLKIGNPASINERCLELHNSKKSGGSKIKVFKGRKMAGRMGGKQRTVKIGGKRNGRDWNYTEKFIGELLIK